MKIKLAVILLVLISCQGRHDPKNLNPSDLKEPLIKANKEAARTESEQIDDFILRHGWNIANTSTGLRYMIYKAGNGPKTKPGMNVKLNYTLTLLTGDTVYTSALNGPLQFEVGKGEVISGLEEAILLLKVGDRAKIIIPSHLAFGLTGDQDKINFKASLVYDLELVSMN